VLNTRKPIVYVEYFAGKGVFEDGKHCVKVHLKHRGVVVNNNDKGVNDMDTNQNIAISRIADILSSGKLIVPETDIWKKIFYNAGLGEIYEDYRVMLVVTHKQINWEDHYYFNDRCFSALLEIFQNEEFKTLVKLLNSILEKITLYRAFDEDIHRIIRARSFQGNYFDIVEHIKGLKSDKKANEALSSYPSMDFSYLKRNLNMLNLDVAIQEGVKLVAVPFTYLSEQVNEDTSLINSWLSDNYPNIFNSYEDAKKAYGISDAVGCLTHCRSIITGFCTYMKDEQTTWLMGLKEVCKRDKNIVNIARPKDITDKPHDPHNTDVNRRYRYPRFNIIYKVYSYLSALGAHVNEGNIVADAVDVEDTDMTDAFLGLRMTEDILIWLFQNKE